MRKTIYSFNLITFLSFIIFLIACQPEKKENSNTPTALKTVKNGTQRMVDSLNAIYARTIFRKHPYANRENLKLIEQEINQNQGNIPIDLAVEYGKVLFDAGRTGKSMEVYNNIFQNESAFKTINQKSKSMYDVMAMSWLRKGEQDNCIQNHSGESCIFPIQGTGVHVLKNGAQEAIKIYSQILEKFPEDLKSRWLLNLAYMNLGQYPNGVPKKWLIPPSSFQSEYDIPPFKNIAIDLGLDVNKLAGGTIVDDFDNDGLIDIVASSWGMKDQIRYYKNMGDGQFANQTKRSGLKGISGGLNLQQADFNNDGHLDFIILRGAWYPILAMGVQPNSLIRNNGDGTFSDVTFEAGIYSVHPTQSATWLDFNNDGWIDLFIANETQSNQEVHPCEFYINNGDGTFTDIAPQLGLNISDYFKGVGSADINNDGLMDIYISNLNGNNLLFFNEGGSQLNDWKFSEISTKAGVENPQNSFPLWFFDYDNDGDEDLFVISFDSYAFRHQTAELAAYLLNKPLRSDIPRLFQNQGDGTFKDITKTAKLARPIHSMGCNIGDIDNDGYLDFYAGTGAPDYHAIVPNRMFRNNQGKTFQDVTTAGRVGHLQKGHSIGFADFDNDGDQDIYAIMGGSVSGDVFQNAFFLNPGNENNWITIKLKGSQSNRAAIGARIRLRVKENGNERQIYATVSPGASFGGNSLQQEMGIGKASEIISVDVNWPNKQNEYIEYGPTSINHQVIIEEDKKNIMSSPMNTITF